MRKSDKVLAAIMIIMVIIIGILVINIFIMQNQLENVRQKVYGSAIIIKQYQDKQHADKFNYLLEGDSPYNLIQYNVSCESESMFPTTTCRDTPIGRTISKREELQVGRMYTYDLNVSDEQSSIMHRLVACLDDMCNNTIFKGDNNYIAEIVPRSAIKAKIEMISFG